MNPLSIEPYKRCNVDITADPLVFSVNNQHVNGGIAVDIWARTNLGSFDQVAFYSVSRLIGMTHARTWPRQGLRSTTRSVRCAHSIWRDTR